MSARFPNWTQKIDWIDLGGRDFLGLQSVGNQIMGELIPGLTSSTRQPRYYTFFSWVLKKSKDWGNCKTVKEQKHFLYRMENIWLYCWKLHKHKNIPVGTPVGATAGEKNINELVKRGDRTLPISLGKAGRSSQTSAFSPPFYRPSMNELGLFGPDALWLPSERGELLANEFEKSIRKHLPLLEKLSTQDTAKRDELEKLSSVLCPCNLPNFPEEESLLLELIMGTLSPTVNEDRQRRLSLLWILDMVSRAPKTESPSWHFPDKAYCLHIGTKRISPHAELRDTIRGWAIFQHRVYIQYGLTGLWYAALKELQLAPNRESRVETITARLCDQIYKSKVVESLIPDIKRKNLSQISMRTLLKNLTGADALEKQDVALNDLEDVVSYAAKHNLSHGSSAYENKLCEVIDEEYYKGRHHVVAIYSLLLICATIFRWANVNEKTWDFGWGLDAGKYDRLSLRSLQEDLLGRLDNTVSEYLLYALRKYVIDQHFLFATRKLAGGSNTFHFEMSEGGIKLVDHNEGQWTGANYISSSLEVLNALRMIQDTGDGTYKITPAGNKYLEKTFKV